MTEKHHNSGGIEQNTSELSNQLTSQDRLIVNFVEARQQDNQEGILPQIIQDAHFDHAFANEPGLDRLMDFATTNRALETTFSRINEASHNFDEQMKKSGATLLHDQDIIKNAAFRAAEASENVSKTLKNCYHEIMENSPTNLLANASLKAPPIGNAFGLMNSSDYISAVSSLQIPRTEFILPDPMPIPPPAGGDLITSIVVDGGKGDQIGNVLNDEFHMHQFPDFYLTQHENTFYWHIEVFMGTKDEAWELLEGIENAGKYNGKIYDLIDELRNRTRRVGYVYISNRPVTPIRFYLFDMTFNEQVRMLAATISRELKRWKFLVIGEESTFSDTENMIPEGAYTMDKFDNFCLKITVDGLKEWIKSHLLSLGKTVESVSVMDLTRGQKTIIQYQYEGCLVCIQTDVIEANHIIIRPEILSWVEEDAKRTRLIDKCQAHIGNLLIKLREDIRWEPIKPKNLNDLGEWFDYFGQCKAAGMKYTLRDLAKDASLSYGYIRTKHSEYQAQHSI